MVVLGLYAEGRTDKQFLPIIIQRTLQDVLHQYGRPDIEVTSPIIIDKPSGLSDLDECILYAAREAFGYHALIVHSDSDDRGYKQTLVERFHPGQERIKREAMRDECLCEHIVPIIPIRMTEAWMLADPDALCRAIGISAKVKTLGLPGKAKLVEAQSDPKALLHQVIQKAYPHQSTVWKRIKAELYEILAPEISLERLFQVSSYQQFVQDLTTTLHTLRILQ